MKDLFRKRFSAALSVLLTGVVVEVVLAVAKNEPVSIERFATLIAILLVLSVALKFADERRARLRQVVAIGLIFIGILAAASGVTVLLGANLTSSLLANVVGTAMVSCGVIVVISGVYVNSPRGVTQPDDPGEYRDIRGKTLPIPRAHRALALTTFDGEVKEPLVNVCRDILDVNDLQFIGYYVDGKCRFCVDILNDNSDPMELMRGEVAAEARRARYEAYGRFTRGFVRKLDEEFEPVDQGPLIRVVLDVARGAFYYMKVDERRFLFGATMNQEEVDVADKKLRDLAERIEKLTGLLPEGPLSRPTPAQPSSPPDEGPLGKVVPLNRTLGLA